MAWFIPVIELDGGRWACRRGEVEYDVHSDMTQAIEHMKILAAEHQPANLFLHRLDGTVRHLGAV